MAISVNWLTGEITVPKADMPVIQVSPEVRQLDTQQFWLDLKDLEAEVDGIIWPDTQLNFPSYTISGFTYAQAFLIIDPYFVTFEDGQYAVALSGTNNNILDKATSNQVSILSQNSGGLIEGRGLTPAQEVRLNEVWKLLGLDSTDPVEVTPTGIDSDSGDIDINFSGDGVNLTRQERQ